MCVDTDSDNNSDNNHQRHLNNLRSNEMNPNNKGNWKRKQKNFNGENGTTPETNTLSAEKKKNHLKGQQKKKKSK